MPWTVVLLDDEVAAELEAQSTDIRARFRRIVELIESMGLNHVCEPYVRHVRAKSGRCA